MDEMATVIGRLAEIESAAVGMERHAAEQKKELAAEYEARTRDFDQEMDAQTEEKLKKLREKLKQEAEEELQSMRQATNLEVAAMEREYKQNHKKLATELFQNMIGE